MRSAGAGRASGRVLTGIAALLVWTGCAGDKLNSPISQMTSDGLAKVSSRGPGVLFVKPDQSAGSYDDIMIAKVGINYAPGQKPLTQEQEDAIYDRMVQRLYHGVAAGFPIAKQPGPCTVTMGVYLKDVDFYESSAAAGSQTRFVSSYGAATLVFEFRDSTTDEPLARYGQRRSFGSGVDAGGSRGPDLDRLGKALDAMLEDVGATLKDALQSNVETGQSRGCHGNLGRALAAS